MKDEQKDFTFAHLTDSTLSKLKQYEEDLKNQTSENIVLVAYQDTKATLK